MTDLDALLEAVVAAPDDWAPRGVLADWLEENGDARHDTVRRARFACQSLAGFPDHRARVPLECAWEDLGLFDVVGDGPRYLRFDRMAVPAAEAVIARVHLRQPVELVDWSAAAEPDTCGAVSVRLARDDKSAFLSACLRRMDAWQWAASDIEPPVFTDAIEVRASGGPEARLMVMLALRPTGKAEPRPP